MSAIASSSAAAPDLAAVKTRQQAAWSTGNYAVVGTTLQIVPVRCMVGKRSTASAHGVARLLTGALPRVEVVEFEDLGHMGPVRHPERVNAAIREFLERV